MPSILSLYCTRSPAEGQEPERKAVNDLAHLAPAERAPLPVPLEHLGGERAASLDAIPEHSCRVCRQPGSSLTPLCALRGEVLLPHMRAEFADDGLHEPFVLDVRHAHHLVVIAGPEDDRLCA